MPSLLLTSPLFNTRASSVAQHSLLLVRLPCSCSRWVVVSVEPAQGLDERGSAMQPDGCRFHAQSLGERQGVKALARQPLAQAQPWWRRHPGNSALLYKQYGQHGFGAKCGRIGHQARDGCTANSKPAALAAPTGNRDEPFSCTARLKPSPTSSATHHGEGCRLLAALHTWSSTPDVSKPVARFTASM